MENPRYGRWLSVLVVLWFAAFLAGPLALVAATSVARRGELGEIEATLDFSNYLQLMNPLYAGVLERTLFLAGGTTLITLLVAYPAAYAVSRLRPSRRTWALALISLPFWTNFLVRVLAFIDVLRLKPFGADALYSATGVLAAMVYNYLPFALLPLCSAMIRVPEPLIEAARDLGAGGWALFRRVLWPLTKRSVAASALMVFVTSLGEFLIPELVGGGRFFTLGTFLQNQFLTARNWPLGAAVIMVLCAFTAVSLVAKPPRPQGDEA